MSDNIRTALYGADYTVTLASRDSTAAPMLSRDGTTSEHVAVACCGAASADWIATRLAAIRARTASVVL